MNLSNYIRNLYNQHGDTRLVFHNYAFAKSLVEEVDRLSTVGGVRGGQSVDIMNAAAWFYSTGYLFDFSNPLEKSIEQFEKFADSMPQLGAIRSQVVDCLRAGWGKKAAESPEEMLFSDAVNAAHLGEAAANNADLIRLELELMDQQTFSPEAWTNFYLSNLLNFKFNTADAKSIWEPILGQRILQQKERLEKIRRKAKNNAPRVISNSEDAREAQRMISTYFRSNYRVHINLSAIADNKANIMISVNAILISVLISILSYRNLTEANPEVFLPTIIFLIFGLLSLIFAVLSARPKVTKLNQKSMKPEELKKNLVFYGNFVNLELEQYEEGMEALYNDPKLMLENMTRDMYHLGKVLDKKYRFLTISYNVFMVGFVATVILFIATLLF